MIFGLDYSTFLEKNLVAVLFIYGFSFFYLFLSIMLSFKPLRMIGLSAAFSYLMLFALSHGIVEWMDMYMQYMRLVHDQEASAQFLYIRLTLLILSFLFLFAFGLKLNLDIGQTSARTVGIFAGFALILLSLAIFAHLGNGLPGPTELSIMSRNFLCLPASVLAGVGLYRLSRNDFRKTLPAGHRGHFRWCGYTMIAYGILAGLVGQKGQVLLSPHINSESFLAFTGAPVELLRSVAALFISYFLTRAMALRISQRLVGVFGAFFVVFFILAFSGHVSMKLISKAYEKTVSLSSEGRDHYYLLRTFDRLYNVSLQPSHFADQRAYQHISDVYLRELKSAIGEARSWESREGAAEEHDEAWEQAAFDRIELMLDRQASGKGGLNASDLGETKVLLDALAQVHQVKIDMLGEEVGQQLTHYNMLTIVLFLTSMTGLAIIGYTVHRTLIRPLHILRAGATQIAKGNLGHKIHLGTADELQDLSSAFNRMADRIVDRTGRLRREAITDGLTGLFNHKHFHNRLEFEINRAIRGHSSLSILLIDVDNFKQYNDRYGHPAGDEVLRKCAVAISATVRSIDIAARYGGEEFAIVLGETAKKGALVVAENIRRAIEEQTFHDKESDITHNVTVSIGVSSYPADTTKMSDLIKMADDALYTAKRNGKNRVCAS